jgi:hypothetical protein
VNVSTVATPNLEGSTADDLLPELAAQALAGPLEEIAGLLQAISS